MPKEKKFFCELGKRQKRNLIKEAVVNINNFSNSYQETIEKTKLGIDATITQNSDIIRNHPQSTSPYLKVPESNSIVLETHLTDMLATENGSKTIILNENSKNNNDVGETCMPPTVCFKTDLSLWAVENSVCHSNINSLLYILRKHGHNDLPADARTLLKTPRENTIIFVAPGFYSHFGISESLSNNILKYFFKDNLPKQVLININIDGLPLAKSSGSQFWPILASIVDNFKTEPFIVGVYHGYHKPENPNEFLRQFINEMKTLKNTGVNVYGRKIDIKLNAIICDSPAKAFVTCVKGHNAYFGCGKCTQEGEYVDGRMTYPEVEAPLRTDESFAQKSQEEHHKEGITCALLELDIGMITNFPLDYMHLCCLGVMKRLLQFWCRGSKNIRMNKNNINNISTSLLQIRSSLPKEFCRKPRALEELDRFKATEFRQFLLYTGIIFLKNNIKNQQYVHFLCFSLALRILISQELHQDLNEYAHLLLVYFVTNYSKLYSSNSVSYNVHNLVHLCKDVKNFGKLDNFSAFKYENFMRCILQKIKSSAHPLQQLCNRIGEASKVEIEKANMLQNFPAIVFKKNSKDMLVNYLQFDGFSISFKEPNNTCILTNGDFVSVTCIKMVHEKIVLKVKKYHNKRSIFFQPCDSQNFNMILINEKCQENICLIISASDIKQKCLKLPLGNDEYAILPLIHTE